MIRINLICILFLLTLLSFAQIPEKIASVLSTKDFIKFKTFSDNFINYQDKKGSTGQYLELEKNYYEGIVYFWESNTKYDGGVIFTYKVTMLATDKTIFYYILSEKKNKKVNSEWVNYYDTIVKYRNDSIYKDLKSSYKKTYLADLNENELFDEEMVYGEVCGYGNAPKERVVTDEYIKNNDKESLLKWLQSTYIVKKVYGVRGFYYLKWKGIKLNDIEKKMIKAIKKINGEINVCRWDLYDSEKIKTVIRRMNYYKNRSLLKKTK